MAEAQTPKRPQWFWPGVAIVVLVLAAGGFAAPSVIECTSSSDGFANCLTAKLAGAGVTSSSTTKPTPAPTAVGVAQPADTVEMPPAAVTPPDFGVRVEADGSLIIAGSGVAGKQVQIFVNGELYGTADVDKSGDWVLVPDAPLPPGGYELTVVDPVTSKPLDKSYVVAINADKTSEPLVVASTPGKASDILQGLAPPIAVATADQPAEPATPEPAVTEPATPEPATTEPATPEPATTEPATTEPATTEPAAPIAVATADQPAEPATPEPAVTEPATPEPATTEPAKPEVKEDVATATPQQDVVGDVDALQQRIDALGALAAPSIDAIEIDKGRNFFAGTGADGAVVRVYVDNVLAGDTKVADGHWLLETDDVLKNRSQRVRVDQLMPGTAEVASRAEVDFIFEEPAAAPAATAVAEAPIIVPAPDYGIDTDQPAIVPVEPPMVVAVADTAEPAAVEATPAETAEPAAVEATSTETAEPAAVEPTPAPTAVAEAPIIVPQSDFSIDTNIPAVVPVPAADQPMVVAAVEPAAAPAAGSAATAVSGSVSGSGDAVAMAPAASGTLIEVPKPDFSVDTGLPVKVVPDETAAPVAVAEAAPPAEPAPAVSKPEPIVVAEAEPAASIMPAPTVSEPEIPKLVAKPVGPVDLGRFATGKAIIRTGDNLWTIARRAYGSGVKYTQIYGANRDQIRNPNLIYPGQVFDLPESSGQTASN